ncbi:MAG: hypothetical protein OEV85_13785 [Candidatus Thorarchaeota archaeon]|nr:hypothetical protein [Candidatus Thorarchaeota archaeon]
MDRIDTESEVHFSSIHEDLKTRTLYEMVTAWAEQLWDGNQYKRISEELWDSIDASDLMEGPYGVSVTLLESCIVDSTEALQAGQFTEEQAVDGLKKLLENDDFVVGARVIEVCVETNPVCRISNIDRLLQQSQSREPLRWTRRMKIGFVVSLVTTLGVYIVMIGLQLWEPIRSLSWLVIGIASWILLYYLIKRNSPTFYRVMWPLGHACIFAMGWFILIIPLGPFFSSVFPPSPDISYRFFAVFVFWIGLGSCMVIGGILGDRLGKKRNYRPYML